MAEGGEPSTDTRAEGAGTVAKDADSPAKGADAPAKDTDTPAESTDATADDSAKAPAGATVVVDREHPSGATVAAPSRRFPRFTRGVARPEGGGRAASGDAPAPARQWPMLAVLCTAGLGLLITAFDAFRVGTILVGLALVGGAVLRWALPSVGMLAVRSRFTDMVTYGVLGTVIVLLAMMAQPDPWLEIPFLGDTLHFTIK
ncbi:DUF3017 domain-containing protein [Streptomyces sp. NA04227]|nr:DUF3017 domain-containing protein [Streptomyces sp. NA04227]